MKKTPLYLIVVILLAAVAVWYYVFKGKKNAASDSTLSAPYVSKHSDEFNESLSGMMDSYFNLTEAFVNWDTSSVVKYSAELHFSIENLKIGKLKIDDLAAQDALSGYKTIKSDMASILKSENIGGQREALNNLSRSLYHFLQTVSYDIGKVYYQECPMAFNDVIPGNWLSRTDAVRNPYLGTKHPKYKSGMLKCGGPKDTLNFMQ